jgi:hypothetical protein
MTAMLVFVAELSYNIFSVLAVFICFCGVFLFIMRFVTLYTLLRPNLLISSSLRPIS